MISYEWEQLFEESVGNCKYEGLALLAFLAPHCVSELKLFLEHLFKSSSSLYYFLGEYRVVLCGSREFWIAISLFGHTYSDKVNFILKNKQATKKEIVLWFETALVMSVKHLKNTFELWSITLKETSILVCRLIHLSSSTHSVHSWISCREL